MVAPEGIETASNIKNILGIEIGDPHPTGLIVDMPTLGYDGVLDMPSVQWLFKALGRDR